MKKFVKSGILISSFLLSTSLACYAGTNLEFALKLAKDGYPELAQKYLDKPELKNDPNKEGLAKVLSEIELQMANSSTDLKTRTEHIKKAAEYSKGINRTPIEKAEFSISLANLIRKALKEPGLSDAQRSNIASEVVPYFEEGKTQFKTYLDASKVKFEEFMEKAQSEEGQKFLGSAAGKAALNTIYKPYVTSMMQYFECVVEKANLLAKGDPSRCTGLDKVIDEADTFGYTVDAPVPSATIGTYVARIYGLLSDCGTNAKENLDKALEKFKEVLATETNNSGDAAIIKGIKSQAINGMIEMALRTSDYDSALEAIDRYTVSGKDAIMPSSKFGIDDFEILLNGLLVNANAFKKAKDDKERDKYTRNIEKLRIYIENGINRSNSQLFWKKKLNSYITASMMIMGKDVNDPSILAQLADDKKNEGNFEEAMAAYEKVLASKMNAVDKVNKRPSIYFSYGYCAYSAKKFELAVKAMRDFFAEFSPSDPKYKSLPALKENYIKCAKLYYNVASKVYNSTKADADKDAMMKSLDILGTFVPEGVVFIKIGALQESSNYIDAIKLSNSVKKDSVDYDKALYFKGISQFNYSKEEKSKNNDAHNELSTKMAGDSIATFKELLAFMKSDPTDIIQDKKEQRRIWEREAKKLIAFNYLSLEDYKNATSDLLALNEEYKKTPEDKKSSNRLYVIQGLLTCYSKFYSVEKENNAKQEQILKSEASLKELLELDVSAFAVKDGKKTPEERKKDFVKNNKMAIGMMMFTNPLKDSKITEKGVEYINEGSEGKKIENKDLFFARKFLELKNYESASISLLKVLKEYEDKGMSLPLKPEDFTPLKNKFLNDESRTFFKNNFETHAFQQTNTAGEEIKKNTRDYGRLKRNLEYISTDGLNIKTEDPDEKILQGKFSAIFAKDKVWAEIKTSEELTKVKKKLYDFLTFLGIIDDLYICNFHSKQFEEAIKYAEILRTNYPGILAEDKKLANLKFEFGKFLMKEKSTEEKAIAQIKDAFNMFIDIRSKVSPTKSPKLFNELNEKRLMCSAMIFKLSQDKKNIDDVMTALRIMYSNQEAYAEYTNLFAVLEEMGQLPEDLKPLTPEQIRQVNADNDIRDQEAERKAIEEKDKIDELTLKKRKLKQVGTDCSFLYIEMRDLENSKFDLYKSYYEKIKGVVPLKANATEKDLVDAFNSVIRLPGMHKMLPKEELNIKDPLVEKLIKEIDEYSVLQGARAEGTIQTISTNRLILEACFPQLPKVF